MESDHSVLERSAIALPNGRASSLPAMATKNLECVVCTESKATAEFPGAPLTDRCNHAPGTCLECVSGYIRTHIESGLSIDVPCPECTGIMSPVGIQRYADIETRDRYDELRLHRLIQQDEDFIWCSAGCGSGQIHEDGLAQPIVKCASCGCKTCFLCEVPWHVGVTCDEWSSLVAASAADETSTQTLLQRAQELRASKDTIDQTTKPCPSCSWNIERNGGCSHMTCIKCMYQFCWECMADFQEITRTDNYAHREECRFYTRNLE